RFGQGREHRRDHGGGGRRRCARGRGEPGRGGVRVDRPLPLARGRSVTGGTAAGAARAPGARRTVRDAALIAYPGRVPWAPERRRDGGPGDVPAIIAPGVRNLE